MDALRAIALDPRYHDIFAILKGARNGFVYGVKVRFPHALVMSALFGRGPWIARLAFIWKATKVHALNLAKFVSIYKTMLLLQRTLNTASSSSGKKERSLDTFFAGLVGGWVVFGERTAINEQIVLYVLSRIITSFLPRQSSSTSSPEPSAAASSLAQSASKAIADPAKPKRRELIPPGFPYPKPAPLDKRIFEIMAALVWGTVMWQFRHNRERLAGGMVSSMQYLYLDSEVWSGIRNLFWHNK